MLEEISKDIRLFNCFVLCIYIFNEFMLQLKLKHTFNKETEKSYKYFKISWFRNSPQFSVLGPNNMKSGMCNNPRSYGSPSLAHILYYVSLSSYKATALAGNV